MNRYSPCSYVALLFPVVFSMCNTCAVAQSGRHSTLGQDTVLLKELLEQAGTLRRVAPQRSEVLLRSADSLLILARQRAGSMAPHGTWEHFRSQHDYIAALLAMYAGDMDRAGGLFVHALELSSKFNDRPLWAECLSGYGLFLGYIGQSDSAIACHREAARLNKVLGDSTGVVTALANEGAAYYHQGNTDEAERCFIRAMIWLPAHADPGLRAQMLDNMQAVKHAQGRISEALEVGFQSLALREKAHDDLGKGWTCIALAGLYEEQEEWATAYAMVDRAIALFQHLDHPAALAEAYFSRGSIEHSQGHGAKAIADYGTSVELAIKSGDGNIPAMAWGQMALIAVDLGQLAEARVYVEKSDSAAIAQQQEHVHLSNLLTRAVIFKHEGKINEAIRLAEESKAGEQAAHSLKGAALAARLLESLYAKQGRWQEAHRALQEYTAAQDSLKGTANAKRVVRDQLEYAHGKQQLADSLRHEGEITAQVQEVHKQKLVRNGFMGGFALVALFAGVFFFQRNRIGKEKARSEELLLNILPAEVAEELKAKGAADAKLIDQATVLFTDFKGFTALSEQLSPENLVKDLHTCFSAFDAVCTKYGIEKIKTIGDAYMAAGGLPTPNSTNAADVVHAALEIRDIVAAIKDEQVTNGRPFFEVRIGVHTGPVVAGIVGVKKFQYDIWGDTVNIASRMESSGEVGQVNISEATFQLVKHQPERKEEQRHGPDSFISRPAFHFTPRGQVMTKGKGEMEMYFVQRSL